MIVGGGYGFGRALGAHGYGFAYDVVVPPVEEHHGGGSGWVHHHKDKYHRPPSIKEFVDVAMSEIYEAGTRKEIPLVTKQAFANIVKPYAKGKAKIPDVDKVNWKALEADVARVEQLLALWQMHLDDEEIIIAAYLNYYH